MKPRKLRIRDGARWTGHIKVLQRLDDGRFVVDFDAESPHADEQERYVLDRAVLTAAQIREWTGVDVEVER